MDTPISFAAHVIPADLKNEFERRKQATFDASKALQDAIEKAQPLWREVVLTQRAMVDKPNDLEINSAYCRAKHAYDQHKAAVIKPLQAAYDEALLAEKAALEPYRAVVSYFQAIEELKRLGLNPLNITQPVKFWN